jgi:hypothetical protein
MPILLGWLKNKRTKMVLSDQVALISSAFKDLEEVSLHQNYRLMELARLIVLLIIGCFKLVRYSRKPTSLFQGGSWSNFLFFLKTITGILNETAYAGRPTNNQYYCTTV